MGGGSVYSRAKQQGGTCCDEHRVLYGGDESLTPAPETSTALYGN